MDLRHSPGLSLVLLLVAWTAPAPAADPPADAPLKEKGLRKAGATYVLPAEAEVQKRLNTARALYRAATAAAAQKQQFEQGVQATRLQIQQLEQELVAINNQLAQAPPADLRNQLVAMNNARVNQLNILRRQGSDENRQVVGARLAADREGFIQAVIDLRKLVDKTDEEYASLAGDEPVKAALETLNRSAPAKVKFALGPSKTYLANVKLLERVEANVLTEEVELRKTPGGVYEVDVTFNGKVTRPMYFDTGAAMVSLPADLAAEIGLKPGSDTPTILSKNADGGVSKVYRMVIPSVRVGKFTVNNVECMVAPPGMKDVPPLLGQSFQRYFSVHFSPEAGKLTLTKLEADEPSSPPTAATKAKAKARSRAGAGGR
jgi:clan AA aspartic protease (TIGR02281 family)